jgi:hypothetical protein
VVEPIFASPGPGQVAQFELYPHNAELLETQVPGFDFERDVAQRAGAGARQPQPVGRKGGRR